MKSAQYRLTCGSHVSMNYLKRISFCGIQVMVLTTVAFRLGDCQII